MHKPFAVLLLVFGGAAVHAQQQCADPSVTDIKVEDITQKRGKQAMANQPLRDLAEGESTSIVFEADVDRGTRTLPAWNDMPFPNEACGEVAFKGHPASLPECSVKNNRLCRKL